MALLNLGKSLENISKIFYENDYKTLMNIKKQSVERKNSYSQIGK